MKKEITIYVSNCRPESLVHQVYPVRMTLEGEAAFKIKTGFYYGGVIVGDEEHVDLGDHGSMIIHRGYSDYDFKIVAEALKADSRVEDGAVFILG
ncbi:MAG: hypothetical protein WC069_00765 [Candidatus Shapirobacteria bacterium]